MVQSTFFHLLCFSPHRLDDDDEKIKFIVFILREYQTSNHFVFFIHHVYLIKGDLHVSSLH